MLKYQAVNGTRWSVFDRSNGLRNFFFGYVWTPPVERGKGAIHRWKTQGASFLAPQKFQVRTMQSYHQRPKFGRRHWCRNFVFSWLPACVRLFLVLRSSAHQIFLQIHAVSSCPFCYADIVCFTSVIKEADSSDVFSGCFSLFKANVSRFIQDFQLSKLTHRFTTCVQALVAVVLADFGIHPMTTTELLKLDSQSPKTPLTIAVAWNQVQMLHYRFFLRAAPSVCSQSFDGKLRLASKWQEKDW